jgi:hypothetical protein
MGFRGSTACLSAFKEVVREVLDTKEHVETMRDFFDQRSPSLAQPLAWSLGWRLNRYKPTALAALAFASAASVAFGLSSLLVSINEREAYLSHRRMAGTVRSIVRSELEKASKAATPSLGTGDFRRSLEGRELMPLYLGERADGLDS